MKRLRKDITTGDLILQLSKRRVALCMPWACLAERAGLSVSTVTRTLREQNPRVGLSTIIKIGKAMGLTLVRFDNGKT